MYDRKFILVIESLESKMPRALTPAERDRVRETLLEAGRRRFMASGVRKTSIAELADDAGIGKGTFYLFFDSKEALWMTLQEQDEHAMRERLVRELYELRERPRAMFRRYLAFQLEVYDRYPLLQVLTRPGEQEAITRKLPAERVAAHAAEQDRFTRGLLQLFIDEEVLLERAPDRLMGWSRVAFALCQQREIVGEPAFGETTELLVESMVRALVDPRHLG